MRERSWVIIITVFFILVGLVSSTLGAFFYSDFNFYRAEISINGNNIEEKLYFEPDKSYHTLYRNFENPLFLRESNLPNYILIKSVNCQTGAPYAYSSDGKIFSMSNLTVSKAYIEPGEYGCTFGIPHGFFKGNTYWIQASYELKPENLFKIDDEYYVKFVVYSPSNHKLLIKDDNFLILGEAITKDFFLPSENVIIYIPYQGDISLFNVIEKDSFEYDSGIFYLFVLFLVSIIPGLLFFFIWRIFGKETTYKDLPRTLSVYPEGRKAWQVNVFFNSPFGSADRNLFPTVLLDFYRRKIIDLKEKGKKNEVWIKIKENKKEKLDEIERYFINFLKKIKELGKDKYIDKQGYFNLKKSAGSIGLFKRHQLNKMSKEFSKKLKEKSKEYIDTKGRTIFIILFVILFYLTIHGITLAFSGVKILGPHLIIPVIIYFVVGFLVCSLTTIFVKFKKNYYGECQEWQAFKRYLKEFPSMRDSPPKAVVLWEHYLVYATALGVGKKVAKKLKEWGIIDVHGYNIVVYTYSSSHSAASHAGAAGGGGGFGGAGAGGVGGGGGGGR